MNIGHVTIYAHGVFLILGTAVAITVFMIRVRVLSLNHKAALRISLLLVPVAFIGGHVLYCGFENHKAFFKLEGISSFGAILACVPVFVLCIFGDSKNRWQWLDAASYSVAAAAFVARVGCFLAHDSMGVHSSSWLAVNCLNGPQYDLALIELIFLAACTMALFWARLRNWKPHNGFVFATLTFSYGLLRLALSQLREMPRRYYGLTVEQFGALILIAFGAGCFWLIHKRGQLAQEPQA